MNTFYKYFLAMILGFTLLSASQKIRAANSDDCKTMIITGTVLSSLGIIGDGAVATFSLAAGHVLIIKNVTDWPLDTLVDAAFEPDARIHRKLSGIRRAKDYLISLGFLGASAYLFYSGYTHYGIALAEASGLTALYTRYSPKIYDFFENSTSSRRR